MKYELSVIIPVFNGEKYLCQCIDSIVSSEAFSRLQVVLIDDGSTDGSYDICLRYGEKFGNIDFVSIENSGVSAARNKGIETAKGEYITFCDADDYYINDIINKASSLLRDRSSDLLFYNYIYDNGKSREKCTFPFESDKAITDINEVARLMLTTASFNSVWNKIFKKEIIIENGLGFYNGQKYGEDRDFVLKYLTLCSDVRYLDEDGYFYRYVESGAVNKPRYDYFDNIQKEYEFKLNICKNFEIPEKEAVKLIEKFAAEQTVSCTFICARNGYGDFLKVMGSLFQNEKLMQVFNDGIDLYDGGAAYRRVADMIIKRNASGCYRYIKQLEAKEKIYKILKRK